ncbi:MAG TPA: hypothetical protein ACFYEH_00070 [Candidatus Brocadiaceae bacterium]|nr:hypothetical protein [Candidatus Woesearchaeota archaeon]
MNINRKVIQRKANGKIMEIVEWPVILGVILGLTIKYFESPKLRTEELLS